MYRIPTNAGTILRSAKSSLQKIETRTILHSGEVAERHILQAVSDSTEGLSQQIRDLQKTFNRNASSDIDLGALLSQERDSALIQDVSAKVDGALPQIARERFLDSLTFDRIDDRYDRITAAHKQTLRWVIEPDSQKTVTWANFPLWVTADTNSSNIYWVTGKPGSGKSTLMRYLVDSKRTRDIISDWASPMPARVLTCFFWNPGTLMQKSMEGLLRTLLHQALGDQDVDDHTIQELCPSRWHSCMYIKAMMPPWSLPELLSVFRATMPLLAEHRKLFIFVDGLDEFGTDRAERLELVNLFLEISGTTNVKMCLSSRPWNEFKDNFEAFPSLKLEDLTRQDMKNFVRAELGSSRAFQDLSKIAEDSVAHLQEQLVQKSDGVFLWLYLVTKRLRLSAQNGKPLRKLTEMLSEMPPDLDEFFQHMLRRIPEEDRVQASKIFQLVCDEQAQSLPTLLTLSFTDEEDEDFALNDAIRGESLPEIRSRLVALRRRLDSQCMDLLVCPPAQKVEGFGWDNPRVEYLHRTVEEFLGSRASQEVLRSYTSGAIDASWYTCNASLAELLFMYEFAHWTSAERQRRKAQLALFEHCMTQMAHTAKINSHYSQRIFECAIDHVDPLLVTEGEILAFEKNRSGSQGPFSAETDRIFSTYQQHRLSVDHKYLLMAILVGFKHYAKFYLTDLRDCVDSAPYLLSAFSEAKWNPNTCDPDLFQLIIERGVCNKHIKTAGMLFMGCFELIRSELLTGNKSARITKLLLEKTAGMKATMEQLINFQCYFIEEIRVLFMGSDRDMLIEGAQDARMTWTAWESTPAVQSKSPTVLALTKETIPVSTEPRRAKQKFSLGWSIFGSKTKAANKR